MQKVTPQITPPRCLAPVRRRHRRFTHSLAVLGFASLTAGWLGTASAGEHLYDFNTDPNAAAGFTIFGANAANAWQTNNGQAGPNDGFLQITPNVNSMTLGILFPLDYFTNADNSTIALPLKGFFLEADVRIGNATGNNGRPADGFSISFAANNDPVVYWGKQGNFRGWAGGDANTQAQEPASFNYATGQGAMDPAPCDAGNAENGTKTGVSVQFDTWQGNIILDQNGAPAADNVGWRVHYNGKMIDRVNAWPASGPLATSATPDPTGADVNGLAVCPAPAAPTDFSQDPSCAPAILADVNTIQTGPYTAGDSSISNLLWAHLSVYVDTNATHQLTVTYKGRTLVDHVALTNFAPYVGQIVMGGRTGGANEERDVDNVHVITYPSVQSIFNSVSSSSFYINDFSVLLQNIGPAKVNAVTVLTLDGTDIKSAAGTTITFGDPNSTIKYAPATPLPAGSHTLVIGWTDAAGNTLSQTVGLSTTPYTTLPASVAVASVDTTKPGFVIRPHQTLQGEPNRMYWADEQLMGLHGTNCIDFTPLPAVNGAIPWASGPVDFDNGSSAGQFPNNIDWGNFGIPSPAYSAATDPTANIAAEVTAYLYFPAKGLYVMGGNSDDGLRVTFARNAGDLLGTQVPGLFADVGRGIGNDQNVGALIVTNAGYYGFRMLYENGGGGAGLEWYFKSTPGAGSTNILINDTLNNASQTVLAYQSSTVAPPYVSFAEPPLNDDQVTPDADYKWQITDGATTVNSGSVVLKLNGVQQTVTPTSAGGVTTISLPHTPGSPHPAGTNTVELSFKDSANANYDYNYSFVIGGFTALPASTAAKVSDVDATKPGFNMRIVQVDQQGGQALPNREHVAEQVLAGIWGPTVATVSTAAFPLPGFINFDIAGPDGNFNANNGFPDVQFPGLPGTGTTVHNLESFAVEYNAWVVFPAEGTYELGVNSDDGFWTKLGTNKPSMIGQLTVVSPASVAGDKTAVLGDQIGTPNKTPLTGKLVLADPVQGCGPLNNSNAIAGNIALIERGTCTFQTKVDNALAAGAIAVVIAQSRPEVSSADGWFPVEMGADHSPDPIPAIMTDRTNYFALTNAMASGAVTVTLQPFDKTGNLGDADVGRGATDTNYKLYVPAPGAYPLRTVYWQGGGGANCEWYSIVNGAHVLLNNTTNSASLLAYRAAKPPIVVTNPTLSVAKQGSSWVLTYTGNLYSSPTISANTTWTLVGGASSPYTIPGATKVQFYRAGP